MKLQFMFFVMLLAGAGCDEKGKNELDEFHPFEDESYKGNNPFNYIHYNAGSIYIFKQGGTDGASNVSILEIPKEKTRFDDSSVTFVRYYDFSIECVLLNRQLTKRKLTERDRERSSIRNFMTYIFALDCSNMPALTHYKHFNKKTFEREQKNALFQNDFLKVNYFIFDPALKKTIWINPYDGYSAKEQKLLKWLGRFLPKISYVESYCFDNATGNSHDLYDYFKINDFIIPKEEVFAGMYRYPDSKAE